MLNSLRRRTFTYIGRKTIQTRVITVAMGQLQQSLITYIITGFDGNEELKLAVE